MGNVPIDYLKSMGRIAQAGAKLDTRWVEIIAYHAALEAELNTVLEHLLPRGSKVTGDKPTFTFGHKIAMLNAAWKADGDDADKVCLVLHRFNELRNSVAHPNNKDFHARKHKLVEAYKALHPELTSRPDLGEIAQGIITFIADGPFPDELIKMFEGLDNLVNVVIPKALGDPRLKRRGRTP